MEQTIDLLPGGGEAQLVCTATRGSEVLGYVVIDSTVGGRSCGGLRMLPDVDEAEMRGLARAMTLKYGFLGLPQGGAKAGVRGNPDAPQAERWERLEAFGQAIAPLLRSRVYVPATDMGTENADIRHLLEVVRVQVQRRELRGTQSGFYTALTAFTSAKQAARFVGLTLSDCSVAIEGFGKVGSALAQLLSAANARVLAISTSAGAIFNPKGLDVGRLTEVVANGGAKSVKSYPDVELLDHSALLELPVDLLCPCARHNSVHSGNAPRIAARIICPGANNPVTPEAERMLFKRGILCLPDFVTNCGGVLGGTMEFASIDRERIASFIDHHIGARVAWLLSEADRQHIPPRDIAVPLSLSRFEQVQQSAIHPTPLGRLFQLGLEFYRRGWIPGSLMAALSPPYFKRSLAKALEDDRRPQ